MEQNLAHAIRWIRSANPCREFFQDLVMTIPTDPIGASLARKSLSRLLCNSYRWNYLERPINVRFFTLWRWIFPLPEKAPSEREDAYRDLQDYGDLSQQRALPSAILAEGIFERGAASRCGARVGSLPIFG